MSTNYRIESQKFFNAQTSQNNSSWAKAAAAYYRQVGSTNKTNFVDAMAAYYAKINAGTISAPVSPTSNKAVVTNGSSVTVKNSVGTTVASGATYTISGSAVRGIALPATVAGISNAGTTNVPITFTTARTAGQQATVQATYTVANGVITDITIA